MARKLKSQEQTLSGSPGPLFTNFSPKPILSIRAPTTADTGYPIGQWWIRTTNGVFYGLGAISAGSANWSLLSPGASDVDTLTGDAGGAISPAGGNITLAGGTNLATSGAGSTITFNLDAAITLATSVTAPLYTAGAGVDLDITVPLGQDGVIKMGDAAAANKISFTDSADAEVGSLDSDGTLTAVNIDGIIGATTPAAITGTTITGNTSVTSGGNVIMSAVATQLEMNGGAVTDFIGQGTLVAGTVTIANTNIAAGDRIFVTRSALNASPALGDLITTISAAASFTVASYDALGVLENTDVSAFDYFIVRQN